MIRVVNYVIVDDFGVTLNPLLLAGQVHGGTMQGIGQALMEQAVYDSTDGQLVTGTFMDYALPRAADGPSIKFETHNVPCKTNPLGVKGAGEAGAIGSDLEKLCIEMGETMATPTSSGVVAADCNDDLRSPLQITPTSP